MDVKSEESPLERTSNGTNPNKKKTKKKNKSKINEIDVISDKLENCVHITHNGLMVNGNGKQSSPESKVSQDHHQHHQQEIIPSKKKHKNKKIKNDEFAQHQPESDGPGTLNNNNLDKLSDANNFERSHIVENGSSTPPPAPPSTQQQLQPSTRETSAVPSTSSLLPQPLTSNNDYSLSAVESKPNDIIIDYKEYESELQMPDIMALIQRDLSEPYSIYTYRYFIHNWPKLCFQALHKDLCVGAIVCKLDIHRQTVRRGYIAMLAVDKDYRKLKIGTTLVQKAIQAMLHDNADEVVLETEITNQPALRLYENLGFVRDKRLFHYYLNGVDALRLKLWFR